MANKKITVVGDGAEQPLTPEEEHRLEVKVDQMLDPSLPDSKQTLASRVESERGEGINMPAPASPSASKVTKIITKFADDEPELTVPKPSEPASKKVVAKKHAEPVAEKPKKAATKRPKAKAVPKKVTKKLKVTIADGSAPDDLDSKADAITAAALAAEAQLAAVPEAPELAAEVPVTAAVPKELAEATKSIAAGAPPLIQKHSRAPIGVADDAMPDAEPAVSQPLPTSTKFTEEESKENDIDNTAPPALPKVTEIIVDEPEEAAETITVEVEPDAESVDQSAHPEPESATAAAPKKYRPPEGPIQFKRAEVPIQPHKPGEPRPHEEAPVELSEEEAIARAFEVKPRSKSKKTRGFVHGLLRLLAWTILIALILGLAAVAALPSLRHRALELVGLDSTPHSSSSQPAVTKKPVAPEPTAPDIYVARRAGVYNLYANTIDGQHERLVLAGTGYETSSSVLVPNAAHTVAALVSTRDNQKAAGELQQSLSLVNIATGAVTTADTADRVKIIDWFGDRIVYVSSKTSTSTSDTNRYQIVSYNLSTKTRTVLDHTNYLNDVLGAKGRVYYATASSATSSGQFVAIKPDGSSKQVILSAEIAAITRTSYDQVILAGVNKWYAYTLGTTQAQPTNSATQSASRLYVDSPNGQKSAYITATNSIVVFDITAGKETKLPVTDASYPLQWLNNQTLVYRANNADYALHLDGSQPQKIADVYDLAGLSLWRE